MIEPTARFEKFKNSVSHFHKPGTDPEKFRQLVKHRK